MVSGRWRGLLGGLMACAALALLSGCATPVRTEVSRFNAWSAELAGARFAFVRAVDSARELEQLSEEALVEAELQRLGLVRAQPGERARLQVDFSVSARLETRPMAQPIYQDLPVWRPPWRDAAGRIHPGFWGPDPFGPRLVGQQMVGVAVQLSELRLRLLDAGESPQQTAHSVFESTARHEAVGAVALPRIVPWLVKAVFADFPGRSGEVIEVRLDPRTGQVLPR